MATRLSPRGRPFTLREISASTGVSISYLSELRQQRIRMPTLDKAVALADFFGVDVEYFLGRHESPIPPDVRRALAQPFVTEIALRVADLPEKDRAGVLAAIGGTDRADMPHKE